MHRVRPLLVLLGLAFVAVADAQPRDSRLVTVESVALWETESGAELEVLATAELAWTLRYDEEGGFAVRLPGAVRGPRISDLDFADGPVSEVRVRSLGSGGEVSTLIEVAARQPLRVSVISEDRLLRARIDLLDEPPAKEPQAMTTVAQVSSQPTALLVETPAVSDDSPDDLAARLASAEAAIARMVAEEEELRFELQRVRDERDALSQSTRVYRVAERASPCLNVRTEPSGTILDCVEPGTPMGSLSTQGGWNRVRLPDGREAWTRSEFLEPSEATSPAELELKLQQAEGELAVARDHNRALEERADSAKASLERAWEAQQNLSAQLASLQTAKAGAATPSAQSVEQNGDTSSPDGSTYAVSGVASCLNLRPEPDSEERIDCLPVGTRTTVVDVVGNWGQLLLVDGRTGWASMAFLEPAPDLPEGVNALAEARARIRELETAATGGSDLEKRVVRLEGDNSVIQTALDQAKLRVTELEGALGVSENERADLRDELAASELETTDLLSRLALAEEAAGSGNEAEENLEKVRAQLLTTEEELRVATVERTAFLDRLEVLEDDLVSARGETEGLKKELEERTRASENAVSEGQRAAALEIELADARGEIEALSAERDQLQLRTDTAESRITELESDVESQEATALAESGELQARIESADSELKAAIDGRAATETRVGQLETELAASQAELERLKGEIEIGQLERGQQESAATESIAALEAELGEARTRAGALESDLAASSTELDTARERIQTVESDLASSEAETTRLQNALEQGNEERGQKESAASERITALETELGEAQTRVASLESDLAASSTELDTARERIQTVENELESSVSETTRLQTALEQGNEERGEQESAASERITALEAELGEARNQVDSVEHERAEWQKRTETALAEAARLGSALENAGKQTAELNEARSALGRWSGRVEELEAELAGTNEVLKAAVAERDTAREQIESLQAEIEQANQAVSRLAELEAERSELGESVAEAERQRDDANARLEETRQALETANVQLMVTAEPCLNLRAAPGSGEPIDCLPTGTRITVAEFAGEWARVRLADGASGWTARAFIEPVPETPPEVEALAAAKAEIAELQATSATRVEDLEAQAEAARSARLEAESRIGGLENDLDSEKDRALEVEDELRSARERITELQTANRSAGENVAKLAMSLATIERLEGELGEVRTALTAADDSRGELEARLESETETRTQLEAQLESQDETSTQLEAARREIAGLRDRVEAERGQRTELAQRLEAAEGQLALQSELSERVDGQESELETTRLWLTAAEEKNAELEARVAASASFLTDLGEELRREREAKRALEESLGSRVASLETELSERQEAADAQAGAERQRVALLEAALSKAEQEQADAIEPTPEEPESLLQPDPDPLPEPEPATAPAAPAARAAPLLDTSPAVLGAVARDWARAWSAQNVDAYLGFYSQRFTPPGGLDRATWEEQRRARLTRPSFIEVSLADLEVRSSGDAPPAVRFSQTYSSDTFSDIVLKTLVLTWEDGGWRILTESSSPLE